jgi:hypothetical protein
MSITFPLDLTTRLDKDFPCVQFQIVKFKERTLLKDFLDQSAILDYDALIETDNDFEAFFQLKNEGSVPFDRNDRALEEIRKLNKLKSNNSTNTSVVTVENVFLPLPQQLQNNYTPNWEMADMILTETLEDIIYSSRGAGEALHMAVTGFAAAALSMGGQYAQKFGARTPNPKKQALFNGIEPRSFGFDYTFSPQTKQEAEVIDRIITSFVTYSLPTLNTPNSAFFGFPCEYRIIFHNTKGFPDINWCVCTGVSTNYSPNMMQLVESGHASQISLSLLFLEADLRTQQNPGI